MKRIFLVFLWLLAGGGAASAADNLTVLDSNRIERTLGAKEIGGVKYYQMVMTNSDGSVVDFNDYTGLGVVPHEHTGHGDIHFHATSVTADQTFILIDMSDSTNYPHGASAVVLHIDQLSYEIDASGTAEYNVEFYYLENCSVTDCDSHMFYSISGDKTAGNSIGPSHLDWSGSGPILQSGSGGTMSSENMITLNDTDYQTDVALKSTYDYDAATAFPGDGDLILVIDMVSGEIDLSLNVSYHSHDAAHP